MLAIGKNRRSLLCNPLDEKADPLCNCLMLKTTRAATTYANANANANASYAGLFLKAEHIPISPSLFNSLSLSNLSHSDLLPLFKKVLTQAGPSTTFFSTESTLDWFSNVDRHCCCSWLRITHTTLCCVIGVALDRKIGWRARERTHTQRTSPLTQPLTHFANSTIAVGPRNSPQLLSIKKATKSSNKTYFCVDIVSFFKKKKRMQELFIVAA